MTWIRYSIGILCALTWSALAASTINNPHRARSEQKVLHTTFTQAPKTLDPARSYSSNEMQFLGQIVEPILQYHYLKRPYQLIPLTAATMPKVEYLNRQFKLIAPNKQADQVAYSRYTITIKPGIYFQPHPAFYKSANGKLYYQNKQATLDAHDHFFDYKNKSTRELTAKDYIYQIKRLANPALNSPIYSLMSKYILGFSSLHTKLESLEQHSKNHVNRPNWINLKNYPLSGVKLLSKYQFSITIKGRYPQFSYWLSMPFFSPAPWEADLFYALPGMKDKNIGWDWQPVGSGPYYLSKNDPNSEMVLTKNPHFNHESYPIKGSKQDEENGLLKQKGKKMPFINTIIFSLEKESIPRWAKFLQGYYDTSGVSSESFDQVIRMNHKGEPELTPSMQKKGVQLHTSISPSTFYMGFNMLDKVVGGLGIKRRALRAAISIAIDYEEYISLFLNGRGVVAHSPLPPGIRGFQKGKAGINSVVYKWENKRATRRDIKEAKALMTLAGYPGGIDPKTKKPLVLHFDVTGGSSGDDAAYFNWLRKQFSKIGIILEVRATQYNRFQDKMRTGQAQIFSWGWHADYPDPENFLFLLHGPNAKVKNNGENAANYNNPHVNKLFEQIAQLHDGKLRDKKVAALIKIVQQDAPWVFGIHPVNFRLSHAWNGEYKSHGVAYNTLKYNDISPKLRTAKQLHWNQPTLWPLWLVLLAIAALFLSCVLYYTWLIRRKPRHIQTKDQS